MSSHAHSEGRPDYYENHKRITNGYRRERLASNDKKRQPEG